jgi:daunorubicin resistance ABC transporter ATP-binding subunit
MMIEVRGVARSFGATVALRDVSLSVREGDVRALLGRNGAGKTTLVRILATLLAPDKGAVAIGGLDALAHPLAVSRLIGLAGQYAAVDETLTGRENLVMVGRLYRLNSRHARDRSDEVLERLSLSSAADRPVRTYSGGMRRRLDVGACLVGRPRLLLLDEPSTGLDPQARRELWSLLDTLVADGATILLTTQQLEEADRLASSVTIVDRGTVVIEGSPERLKAQLGYETIEVVVADIQQLAPAAQALDHLAGGAIESDRPAKKITFKAPPDAKALVTAVRLLDKGNIGIEDVTARQPSLDDVFLAVASHSDQISELSA